MATAESVVHAPDTRMIEATCRMDGRRCARQREGAPSDQGYVEHQGPPGPGKASRPDTVPHRVHSAQVACGESSTTGDSAQQDGGASSSSGRTAVATVSPTVSTSVIATPPSSTTLSADSSISSEASPATSTASSELTVAQQADLYDLVIRDVYVRGTRGLPEQPGVLLVDHPVTDAGRWPLSFLASASGEPFAPGVLEELSHRLADLPLLGVVASMEEVLGPDYRPSATSTARPGVLVHVSPVVESADGFTVGVEVGPPGGAGWLYLVAVTADAATIVDAQEAWIS